MQTLPTAAHKLASRGVGHFLLHATQLHPADAHHHTQSEDALLLSLLHLCLTRVLIHEGRGLDVGPSADYRLPGSL